MTLELNALEALFDDDRVNLQMFLRKTSEEVLFREESTRQAGCNLVVALDWLQTMIAAEKQIDRYKAYDLVRQYVSDGLSILNLPDDHEFAKGTLFLPTIAKHLRYLASFAQQNVGGDQGYEALNALMTGETSLIVNHLATRYRQLLFML